ncbi:sugar phosphate isomerase/epimerase (plasmid) [Azospirillum oryzae]|uniref:Sugar phosphate isomerase/epimerase n=1 Tax=Azospirillum oryzae TaxID=286727 RepID=A0A6N1AZU8_9PROT|nr:sugar phosphate isomerase/epimerase [Azospirillum oryzae]KAA0585419.1 sugar phosphate isomerase/epimerase [Azospirillum oryzae]QKS54574.1 sugar phosphate isomerase/epimerase [Azospirillum oryzae]GLR77442.1 sugar phosphate isomerase [Azospirillum oryzae]
MNISDIDLLASYWTIAGETYPGAKSEISPFSLRERAEVASRVGWRGMGFVLDDMTHSIKSYGLPTVKSIFADNGIRHVELEFLVDWHLDGARRDASDRVFSEMLDIGSELSIKKIKLGGGVFEEGEPDLPRMRDAFAVICDRAAERNIDIVVEFLPFASINSIDRGLALVDGLDNTNGGLLVDTWHVARGGMSFDEIAKIPAGRLRAVELDDADEMIVGSLFNDSTHHRKLCGEGALDVPAFIQAILDVGYRGYWGVELISAELRKLPLAAAAQRAYETTMRQFEPVRFPAA